MLARWPGLDDGRRGRAVSERSLVDRSVAAPERLVFEGPPTVVLPLVQDLVARRPVVHDGETSDTMVVCPPLRLAESVELAELKRAATHDLAPERAKAKKAFIGEQVDKLTKAHPNLTRPAAQRIAERWTEGVLLPNVMLQWDDDDIADCSVADVLADPERFVGRTLADLLEGVRYGTAKAMVMRRPDGSLWTHSFAHGRAIYDLKFDAITSGCDPGGHS